MAELQQLLSLRFKISLIIVNLMVCIPLTNANKRKCTPTGSVCEKTTDCCVQDVCSEGLCVDFDKMIIPSMASNSRSRGKGKAKARSPQKKKSAKSMSSLDDFYDDEYCSGYGHQCYHENECCSGYCHGSGRYGYCA